MTGVRRRHSGEFKAKVALEALKSQRTVNEIASAYGVHLMHAVGTDASASGDDSDNVDFVCNEKAFNPTEEHTDEYSGQSCSL